MSIEEICDDYIELDQESLTQPDAQVSTAYKALYDRYLNTDRVLRPLML